ncbi:hypothetical protein [Desulforhopalus sp. IMCC35007]|uniref:hypothetical protein n=1 Tax=Desulforhopalus sp. IMCC35007 TaxID=2569543 RepID=UPI0010AEAE27|nr:hypothetical protein [Desulforhopalus sp. IMCC35007]TKB06678.1 hypothetical protein FCL48_19770 [Desulforhopalus sp. IMCC35007]
MIIPIDNCPDVDTDDLSSEERHIIQKLLCWKLIVNSVDHFREKTALSLATGWNNSGPVSASKGLTLVIEQMERELLMRLQEEKGQKDA